MKRSQLRPSAWICAGALTAGLLVAAPTAAWSQQRDRDDRNQFQSERQDRQRDRDDRGQQDRQTIRGRVITAEERRLTIRTDEGEQRTIRATDQTDVIRNNRDIDLQDLQQGDRVTVRLRGGSAQEIEVREGRAGQDRQQDQQQAQRRMQRDRFDRDQARFQQRDREQRDRFTQRDRRDFQQQDRYGRADREFREFDRQQERYAPDRRAQQFREHGEPQFQAQDRFEDRTWRERERYGARDRQQRDRFDTRERDEFARRRFEDDRDRSAYRQDQQFRGERPAGLGVALQETRFREGALVADVYQGSPAQRAGLRPGDLIVVVDDEYVESPSDVANAIVDKSPGEQVRLIVERNGREQLLATELAPRTRALQQEQRGRYGPSPGYGPQARQQYGWQDQYGAYGPAMQDRYYGGPAIGGYQQQFQYGDQRYRQGFRGEQFDRGYGQPYSDQYWDQLDRRGFDSGRFQGDLQFRGPQTRGGMMDGQGWQQDWGLGTQGGAGTSAQLNWY